MFVREALRNKPTSLYMLEDTSPFQEESGYNRVGTSGSTPARSPGLVSGVSQAAIFTNANNGTFATAVFASGQENRSFTIGSWVRVGNSSVSEQQVLGHLGSMDGLLLNGTLVSFAIKYAASVPEARVSFDLQRDRNVQAVGVYTPTAIYLYVNGELVDDLALTEAQQAATFVTSTTTLVSGPTAGSQNIAVNGIYTYAQALSAEEIQRHYLIGTNLPSVDDVVTSFGGVRFRLDLDYADQYLERTWDDSSDWNDGMINNMAVEDDLLVPQFDGDTSLPGTWLTSVSLEGNVLTTMYGVIVDWDGVGAVVETSVNGTSWETTTRGKKTTNTSGITTAGKSLQIRVTFPGGIVDDESYLESLSLTAVDSAVLREQNSRTITLTNSYPQFEYPVRELNETWGAKLVDNTHTLVISTDTSGGSVPVKTIEVWIRKLGVDPTVAGTGLTSPTHYENGVVGDGIHTTGRWTLWHIVSTANITGTITITGPAQIGAVALYETALSATTIAQINNTYHGLSILSANDNTIIALPDTDTGHKVYAHDWSIAASG